MNAETSFELYIEIVCNRKIGFSEIRFWLKKILLKA
jgi:hypothetical protein